MKNIVLTGFMASGKTTIGQALAAKLNRRFIDMDDEIVQEEGRSINEIFAADGEKYFRMLETKKARQLGLKSNLIISTGGGCVLHTENLDYLRQNGIIIFLDADFDVIKSRLEQAAATRPLLQNQNTEQIYKRFVSRRPFYENCDDKIHITADKSPDAYAEEIISIIENRNNR